MGKVLGLLSPMQWVKDLNLVNIDFEMDSKVVADSIYGKDDVSNFMTIINDCRHSLETDLTKETSLWCCP